MNPAPNNAAPLCGTHTDAEFEQVKAELAAAPSDNELSRLRCDAERLREIAGMLEPPFDETTICDRVRNELSALRADRESLMLDRAQLLQRIEELELQIATGIPAATAAQAGKETHS